MKKVYILIPVVIIIFSSICIADYRPIISGDFEVGDKLYTDFEGYEEEIIDKYHYYKHWLKYKKKLSTTEYYYLKYQYYRKKYKFKTRYNNICFNLWGNYTTEISDKIRNRFKINYKDKDYYDKQIKSYKSLRFKYMLDYDPDNKNDYEICIQRQWNNYCQRSVNDNTKDKICLGWEYEMNKNLEINTNIKVNYQSYSQYSQRSNKYSHNFSLGFKYKL